MTHNDQKIKEIAEQVEQEYVASGLSDGYYFDFTEEVAKRYATYILQRAIKSVPEKASHAQISEYFSGFNECRQQTLANLNKLKE